MGGKKKVEKRREEGKCSARERIDRILDPGTFFEVGLLNQSDEPSMAEKTPADGKIAGYGTVESRRVAIIANDFTVLASTSSRVAMAKEREVKSKAASKGYPVIYLSESGGARMPDVMGARGLASFGGGGTHTFLESMTRVRQTPFVTAVMGESYGMATWMACVADFVVQIKGSAMGVSGPRVLELALGEIVTDEELGGWPVHSEITGMTDRVAETEDDCFKVIRQYLSYMPSHRNELPPVGKVLEKSGCSMNQILGCLPDKRNKAYDMNRILNHIVDKSSLFPIKPGFGQTVITALARVDGKVVGIIANQPMYRAGAMDTDGIDKSTSFLCLCDTFNIPLLFFHDTPGFLVGREAERNRVAARVINFLNALALVSVPKISIIVRKSYGMAYWNMCGTGCEPDFHVAWPTAEMSFVSPEIAANVVYGGKPTDSSNNQELWQERMQQMIDDASPYSAAHMHYLHDVIDPRQTREYIIRSLEISFNSWSRGLSENKLANWPTKF